MCWPTRPPPPSKSFYDSMRTHGPPKIENSAAYNHTRTGPLRCPKLSFWNWSCSNYRGSVVVVLARFLSALRQQPRYRRIPHRILPQDHVQLLRVGVIGMAKIHLHALFRTRRTLRVRRVNQVVVAIRCVGDKRRLIPRTAKFTCNQRTERIVVVHRG